MKLQVFIILAAFGLVALAKADGITGSMSPQMGGNVDTTFDGGVSGAHHGTGNPAAGCAGNLDLSAGCPLPMLGGA